MKAPSEMICRVTYLLADGVTNPPVSIEPDFVTCQVWPHT
jgi:hypothetical protein